MRLKVVVYYIGLVVAFIGLFELAVVTIGIIYEESSVTSLLTSGLLMTGVGLIPCLLIGKAPELRERDGIFIVAGTWLFGPMAGALPYLLYGEPFTNTGAMFESVSGFTTTGSTILSDVESLPKWLLFWRATTHWIGGIGIIGIMLAILPIYGKVSHDLLKQEFTSLTGAVLPRAKDVAQVLLFVFVGLTALTFIVSIAIGIHWFDAITNTFGCVATGGFSIRNTSIAYYQNPIYEIVITISTILGGMNFAFLYGLMFPRKVRGGGWETARLFIIYLVVMTTITAFAIHGSNYSSWLQSFRYAGFQIVNCAMTTGFATADSSVWQGGAQFALILVSLVGACAGSTTGGMKFDRIILFAKLMGLRLKKIAHPNAVVVLHLDGRTIGTEMAFDAMLFIAIYLIIVALSTMALALLGMPLIDSFSGTVATIGNVGPGLGTVGSMGNFSAIPTAAKVILTVTMLLGRIEIYAYLMICSRYFWKR